MKNNLASLDKRTGQQDVKLFEGAWPQHHLLQAKTKDISINDIKQFDGLSVKVCGWISVGSGSKCIIANPSSLLHKSYTR